MFNNIPPAGFPQIDLSQDVKRINAELSGIASNCSTILTDITAETVTVSGNPISITDALSADALSVVAEIEPEQDLHGYGKPWSGGAGKNIAVPLSAGTTVRNGITVVNDGNNTITISGTYSGSAFDVVPVCSLSLDAGTYILNGQNNVDPENKKLTLQLYNSDTSTQIANLENENDYTFTLAQTTNILVGVGLRVGCNIPTPVTMYPMIRLASETDAAFEPYSNICPISGMNSVTVTTTDGTDTNTATASLGTTVYGGSVDVTEGSASVEYASVTLTGSETWGKSALTDCDIFVLTLSTWELTSSTLLSHFPFVDIKNYNTLGNAWWDGDRKQLRIGFSEYGTTTIDQFKAWLADNNVQVVAELATPTTLSFTSDDLSMLSGENTISTDAEEVSVEYIKNTLVGRVRRLEEEQ